MSLMNLSLLRAKLWPLEAKCSVIPVGVILWLEGLMERGILVKVNIHEKTKTDVSVIISCLMCTFLQFVLFFPPRFLVQFRQDKVCVKFIQGNQKNGSVPTCKRKNNRLLEVAVP